MKRTRYIFLALTLVLCLGVVFTASAAGKLTAKQMMIDRLQDADLIPIGDINKTSSGSASYEVKAISGALATTIEPVAKLAGADLLLDYELDSPGNKMAMNYLLNYADGKYSGGMFMDGSRCIFTNEILSLLNNIQEGIMPADPPTYLYMDNPSFVDMWENMNNGQYLPPGLKELMLFCAEAIPDQYFKVSLTSQRVSFALDQKGLEDVTLAILNKVAGEKERFATLVADYIAYSGGQQEAIDMIREEILGSIEQSINDGSYPNTAADVENIMAGMITLKELKYEAPIILPGQHNFTMTLDLGGGPEFSSQFVIKSDFTSGKEVLDGTYTVDAKINIDEGEQNQGIIVVMEGKFNQTGQSSQSNGTIEVNVQDYSTGTTMLDLLIEGHGDAVVDKNVQVEIPVITPTNSMDLMEIALVGNEITANTAAYPTVILDGSPIIFDVEPDMIQVENGGRLLVPLRTLAESLGYEVEWVAPDQVNIVYGDKIMNMFVNRTVYLVDSEERQLDAPPTIKNDRIMVPLRFVAEELGCSVQYDGDSNTVVIYSH